MSFYRHFLFSFAICIGILVIPLLAFGQACTDDSDCSAENTCISGQCRARQDITITATVLGGASSSPFPPNVTFEGLAYPNAFVTILRDGSVIATVDAGSNSLFSKLLTAVPAGTSTFGILAEDTQGKISTTIELTISLANGTTTTISNIFLPPTIAVAPTIQEGDTVRIFGQIFPGSRVSIFINSLLRQFVTSGGNGEWEYNIDSSALGLGIHTTKAKATSPGGAISDFSETKLFEIVKKITLPPGFPPLPPGIPGVPTVPFPPPPSPQIPSCPHGDLNGDKRVDLIDFSIMLFWWERAAECPDQNQDGIVDIIDVSILLFWWTE